MPPKSARKRPAGESDQPGSNQQDSDLPASDQQDNDQQVDQQQASGRPAKKQKTSARTTNSARDKRINKLNKTKNSDLQDICTNFGVTDTSGFKKSDFVDAILEAEDAQGMYDASGNLATKAKASENDSEDEDEDQDQRRIQKNAAATGSAGRKPAGRGFTAANFDESSTPSGDPAQGDSSGDPNDEGGEVQNTVEEEEEEEEEPAVDWNKKRNGLFSFLKRSKNEQVPDPPRLKYWQTLSPWTLATLWHMRGYGSDSKTIRIKDYLSKNLMASLFEQRRMPPLNDDEILRLQEIAKAEERYDDPHTPVKAPEMDAFEMESDSEDEQELQDSGQDATNDEDIANLAADDNPSPPSSSDSDDSEGGSGSGHPERKKAQSSKAKRPRGNIFRPAPFKHHPDSEYNRDRFSPLFAGIRPRIIPLQYWTWLDDWSIRLIAKRRGVPFECDYIEESTLRKTVYAAWFAVTEQPPLTDEERQFLAEEGRKRLDKYGMNSYFHLRQEGFILDDEDEEARRMKRPNEDENNNASSSEKKEQNHPSSEEGEDATENTSGAHVGEDSTVDDDNGGDMVESDDDGGDMVEVDDDDDGDDGGDDTQTEDVEEHEQAAPETQNEDDLDDLFRE